MKASVQRVVQSEPENRRQHRRLACDAGLQIQVLSLTQNLNSEERTVTGAASDISAGGLSLRVDRLLPVGCVLDLWVRVRGRAGTFMLTGEVKWITRQAAGRYSAGVQLLDRPTDDVQPWLDIISAELHQRDR